MIEQPLATPLPEEAPSAATTPPEAPVTLEEPAAEMKMEQAAPPQLLLSPDEARENTEMLRRLTLAVEELARVAATRERNFAELHRDNQRLRNEADGRAALPIFRDLVMLFDQLQAAGQVDFADSVAIILERYEVELYHAVPGEPFAPNAHRGVASIPAIEGAADKTIARELRPGFRFNGKPLRPAEVEVYRVIAPALA